MAREEAKVRVRLDTRQAKSDLRGLTRNAAATAGRVGAGIRGAVGRGLGAVGLGGGIGVGLAAVRASTSSGLGDVVGEIFGGIGAQLNEFFLGDMDDGARADKAARDETIQAFGLLTQGGTRMPPGAVNYWTQRQSMLLEAEKGRSMFEQDERFRSSNAGDLIDRIMEGISELLVKAVDALVEKLSLF